MALQLGLFVYKYHTEGGIAFPYTSSLTGSQAQAQASEVVLPAVAAQQQQQQQPVIVYTGASGAGALTDSSGLSAAEIDNMLKPGSSGHSPFDAPRYAGFCRKMRVRRGHGVGSTGLRGCRCLRPHGVAACLRQGPVGGCKARAACLLQPHCLPPCWPALTLLTPCACLLQPPNVPVLEIQRMWLTNKQRNATDVTIVTQLSGALGRPPRGLR